MACVGSPGDQLLLNTCIFVFMKVGLVLCSDNTLPAAFRPNVYVGVRLAWGVPTVEGTIRGEVRTGEELNEDTAKGTFDETYPHRFFTAWGDGVIPTGEVVERGFVREGVCVEDGGHVKRGFLGCYAESRRKRRVCLPCEYASRARRLFCDRGLLLGPNDDHVLSAEGFQEDRNCLGRLFLSYSCCCLG